MLSSDACALAHVAAADEDRVASLPAPLAQNVFSRLPADERARCATVRRSWRAAVLERSLWTRLDMSTTSGVTCTVNDAALLAAAARAGGRLEALDLWGRNKNYESHYSHEALLAVATANSETLRELRCAHANVYVSRVAELETLLRALPRVRVLETSVQLEAADAGRMLRNEPPFEPVRLAKLSVRHMQVNGNNGATALALVAGVLVHAAPLLELDLCNPPLYEEEVLDAVVDAVLERRVRCVKFSGEWMGLTPASVPALVRLLGGDALQELCIFCDEEDDHVLDNRSAGQLAAALRANTALTSLTLSSVLCHNAAASVVLLRALTAHPSLRKLDLSYTPFAARPGASPFRAIAALVAANAPALQELSVRKCGLQDAGLGPLLDALADNTHLRVLNVSANGMSNTFARHRLLPALRANTSLRRLTAVSDQTDSDEFETDAAPYPDTEWFARRAEEERTGELQADAEALVAARGNGNASS
jgi:hypothetical protein